MSEDETYNDILRRMEIAQAPHIKKLHELCEVLGFGRVMQETERRWAEKEKAAGTPGGEFVYGPTRGSLNRMGLRSTLELLLAWETLPADVRDEALKRVRASRKA